MKKRVMFFILDQYADWELAFLSTAFNLLGDGRFETKTVSLSEDPVQSAGGLSTIPDLCLEDAGTDFDALILIGGYRWRTAPTSELADWIRVCAEKQILIAAICDASAYLGTQGMLNEIRHTSNELKDLKEWAKDAYSGEENYISKQAVRDGNIITANGTAYLEFAKEVLLALEAASEETITQWYSFYKLGYYYVPVPDAMT